MLKVTLYKDNNNLTPIDYGYFRNWEEFMKKVSVLKLHSIISVPGVYDGFNDSGIRYDFHYEQIRVGGVR